MATDDSTEYAILCAALGLEDWSGVLEGVNSSEAWLRAATPGDPRIEKVVSVLVQLARHPKWEIRRRVAKGISVLRETLKSALAEGVDIIVNDYHGNYSLTDNVTIGSCNTGKLVEIANQKITELAQELRQKLDTANQKSDGNS